MRDLSLHLLDLIENSIRVNATVIAVTVQADPAADRLRVAIEDNGPGLNVPVEVAADPFYTTKKRGAAGTARTGLGLSLFQAAAERAGGSLTIGRSKLGGAAVEARMQLSHIDRAPLGDLAATISSVACTNPQIDLRVTLEGSGGKVCLSAADVARAMDAGPRDSLAVAGSIAKIIKAGALRVWPEPV